MSVVPRPDTAPKDPTAVRRLASFSLLIALLAGGIGTVQYLRHRHARPRVPVGGNLGASGRTMQKKPIRSVRSFASLQIVKAQEKPYNKHIAAAASEHKIDPALIRAVIQVESNFAQRAVSPKGARGLMQLMPATARQFGVRRARHLYDPRANIHAGTAYLSALAEKFGDTNAELIIAAYNAGPGAVSRWGGVPPYPETQEYVKKVTKLWGQTTAASSKGSLVING